LIKGNEKSIRTLEFPKVKSELSEYALSELGKERIMKMNPSTDSKEIQALQNETEDGVFLLKMKGGIPVASFSNIHPHLKRLEIGASLNGKEVSEIGRVLKTIQEIKDFFVHLQEEDIELNTLYKLTESIDSLGRLQRSIWSVIDEGGHVVDDASQKLKGIRTGIKRTEGKVREKLEVIVRGGQSKYLTDTLITMRNDRYVIPVKAENRNVFGGVVHDQSSTGQTLFVEPQSVLDLNNRLKQYQSEEKAEVDRILAELSNEILPHIDTIKVNLDILVRFDFINAKAEYSKSMKGTRPLISEEKAVNLIQARHPLIGSKQVVANDIIIGDEYKTIIVTGPNTGGKTVVLKTLGLVQLMGQSGLQIPAEEESTIGVFSSIFSDVGDEQSIEQSLSTFSSHLTNIVSILEELNEDSLVLLDELGAGTDPQEGAALAIAMLDYIGQTGCSVMITSHYPELKAYGYNRPKTMNASMEFDVDTLSPTYKLLLGIPGRSNAFEIAERLGLSGEIISSAKQLMSGESQSVDEMIYDLEYRRNEAEERAQDLQLELNRATKLHKDLSEFYKEYQDERENMRDKARSEANEIVEKAEKKADKIIEDLRNKQLEGSTAGNVKEHEFIDTKSRLNNLKHEKEHLKDNKVLKKAKKEKELAVGDEVDVTSFGQRGTLVEKESDKVWVVQMGMLKMKIDKKNLELVHKEKEDKPQRSTVKASSVGSLKTEIDLRGERVEEAVNQLDQYIDQALLSNYSTVSVITGVGTGAVRKGVRDYLKKHSQVKSYNDAPANQGGSGATIVKLK